VIAGTLWVIKDPRHIWEIAAMKTLTRRLRSFNLGSDAHRRRIGECQAGEASLGGAEGAGHALTRAHWTLAVVLALSSSVVHAQTPTCAPPGCNSVTSDSNANTAMGTGTLVHLSTGFGNTAAGINALYSNTTGGANTALGFVALANNTTGGANTALGYDVLYSNTTGNDNTATGNEALLNNSTGSDNTASGAGALYTNRTGNDNTASGFQALNRNLSGIHNTASGLDALFFNNGNFNTALGSRALYSNISGSNNIAIGINAGYSITGSNNIDIGPTGSAGESGVIRIGGPSQTVVYVAGITSAHLTGSPVYVAANGQLGILSSSERYKTEIASMGGSTQKLHELRPVSFHLKSDPKGTVQYGLIAEEVNKVFPELVIRDDAGTIQGVRYDELAPMLLNEVQQQAAEIRDLKQQVAELNNLKLEMRAALVALKSKHQLVARR
jgi:hypothetical protein